MLYLEIFPMLGLYVRFDLYRIMFYSRFGLDRIDYKI